MFQSSLKEAQAFQDFYLPKTGSYYRDNRNYSYDFTNKRNTTSLLSPYIRYRLLSEEDIIKKTLLSLGADKNNLETLIAKAKQCEEDANQILDFTREIKNLEEIDKTRIVKSLWKIIYSDKHADIYETNLMRRLSGLIYIDSKTMGDIKEKIKKENS